jgi:hypothetical protein
VYRANTQTTALVALLVACGGTGAPPGAHVCDPLAVPAPTITLANILGAGRDADGTLYVVDDGGPDHQRAFVSSGTTLQRAFIEASASDATSLTVSLQSPLVSVRIDGPGPHPMQMGVAYGPLQGKTFTIGMQGDVLTLVGPSALTGLTVKNVTNDVVLEYYGAVDDGRRFYVTRPRVDWTLTDFRVFFGTPDDMVERMLVRATRDTDTVLVFIVDGTTLTATIPGGPPTTDPPMGTLMPVNQPAFPFSIFTQADAASAGLHFLCTK